MLMRKELVKEALQFTDFKAKLAAVKNVLPPCVERDVIVTEELEKVGCGDLSFSLSCLYAKRKNRRPGGCMNTETGQREVAGGETFGGQPPLICLGIV